MRSIKAALVALALVIGSFSSPLVAGEKDPLFIGLSSDAVPRVSHVLHFAGLQLMRGHPLTIWLNEKGVLLASRKHTAQLADQQKTLAELMSKGASVLVCGYCMKQFDLKEADLLPGFQAGNPDLVGSALFKDDTKTLSW